MLFWAIMGFASTGFSQQAVSLADGIIDNISIGESIVTTIKITNSSFNDVSYKFYLSDYGTDTEHTHFEMPNTTPRSNASWIKIGISEIIVLAQTTREIPVEITVPDNFDLSGSYWSLIMVEPQSSTSDENDGQGLTFVTRYGLLLVTDLQGGYYDFEFFDPSFGKNQDDAPEFSVVTNNIGTSIAAVDIYLDIYASDGVKLGRVNYGEYNFRPDNPALISFDLDQVFVGDQVQLEDEAYTALLVVDAGEDNLFGARYNLNFQ